MICRQGISGTRLAGIISNHSSRFPRRGDNLEAILNLPKGPNISSRISRQYEAFSHVLRRIGAVRRKDQRCVRQHLSSQDKQTLATLIYYPREKMAQILEHVKNRRTVTKITLYRLIEVSKRAASKYTRSKVRKALPQEFAYVIEELITEKVDVRDKESYYNAIIQTIIRVGRAGEFIVALCEHSAPYCGPFTYTGRYL